MAEMSFLALGRAALFLHGRTDGTQRPRSRLVRNSLVQLKRPHDSRLASDKDDSSAKFAFQMAAPVPELSPV